MWLALQHERPEDFIFATGELHSVQDVVVEAFAAMGLEWQKYLKLDEKFMRPAEPCQLVGNPAKAGRLLNWKPKRDFPGLIREMTFAELESMTAKP